MPWGPTGPEGPGTPGWPRSPGGPINEIGSHESNHRQNKIKRTISGWTLSGSTP